MIHVCIKCGEEFTKPYDMQRPLCGRECRRKYNNQPWRNAIAKQYVKLLSLTHNNRLDPWMLKCERTRFSHHTRIATRKDNCPQRLAIPTDWDQCIAREAKNARYRAKRAKDDAWEKRCDGAYSQWRQRNKAKAPRPA